MQRRKVKPAEGRLIRDPKSKLALPADGKEVDIKNPYWMRRLKSGDIVLVDEAQAVEPSNDETMGEN